MLEEEKKNNYRIFSIVLYDENFLDVFTKVLENDYSYFYIYHDKDKLADNTLKKPHYHLIIYHKNATTKQKVLDTLNIDNNFCNVGKFENGKITPYTLKNSVGYLLHYNMKDKHNYSYDEIISNMQETVLKYYNILSCNDGSKRQFKELIAFIEDNRVNIRDVVNWCIDNNCLDLLKNSNLLIFLSFCGLNI